MTYLVLKTYPDNVCHLESDESGTDFDSYQEACDHAMIEASHRQGKYIVVKIEDIYQGENYDEKKRIDDDESTT